jgi:alpha-1,3-rhamnosyl/mannosyltransferase
MKIGLDVAQTCVERAGCAWYADALSRALIAEGLPRGHTFELYHHFGDWINHDTAPGTMVCDPRVTAPLRGMSPAAARKFWSEVASGEPLPGRPDVVLSFGFHAPKMPHTKLAYTVHDLVFWTRPDFATAATRLLCQRELLLALARSAGLLFVSDSTRREFECLFPEWLGQSRRPHALAPGASRFPPVALPRGWTAGSPWLAVGSVEPRKNHETLLDAYEFYFARSAQRRTLLVAGGSGWKSDKIHARFADLAARGASVRYLGYVPDRELAALYARSFALLATSWHEGFGLPPIEAMGAGIPVVASNCTSLPEVGGNAALYAPPGDPGAIAGLMLALETDRDAYARCAAACLARSGTFSWQATAKSVLEFIAAL